MFTLFSFYRSDEWARLRKLIIDERTRDDGYIYDEVTNKPIVRKYDLTLHHKIELTDENVNDYNISLNPENIMVVSHRTHNQIHDRFDNHAVRKVYIIYGPPLAGKTTWVQMNKLDGDLVIDMDNIWQCITADERYHKPGRLNAVAFKVRDTLIDSVKYRLGKWRNCYLIGGYPLSSERERLAKELQAEEIFIDTTEEECLMRLKNDRERGSDTWEEFIREWFRRHDTPPGCL